MPARTRPRRLALLAAVLGLAVLGAPPVGASTKPRSSEERQIRALQAQRSQVRARKAHSAARVDALKATNSQIHDALEDLSTHVSSTSARLEDARRAADEADAQVAAAKAAETKAEAELGQLRDRIRTQAIEAYVRGTPDDTWSIYSATNANDATNRRTLLEFRSARSLDSLEQFRQIRHDLAVSRQVAVDAAARAKRHRAAVDSELSELRAAQKEQQRFAAQVDDRIDAELAEADSLASIDSGLSSQIVSQQTALARRVAAVSRSSSSRRGGSARTFSTSGGSGIVSVGGIRVAASIAGNVQALLEAARAAGIQLGGGGFRDPAGQIAVRRSNCGGSNYAIYQAPASSCSPPTARPGTSMHERGLAIDFTQGGRTISRGSSAFSWLKANAGRFGLHNLPSEPWHWSTNGN
jgi:septal ring factor EnvC (AmiA/AmiB activator)